jgi:hypothetical protein
MIHLALRHELACAPEVYWACVLDELYNEALFLGALRFARYEILEQTECVTVVRRRVRAEPPPDSVPGFLRKALPYVEEGELDRTRSLYTFRTINVTMPDKVQIFGMMHAAPFAVRRCMRTTEIHVDVKAFGLGGFVETKLGEDLTRSYGVSADFTNRWVR